MPTEGRQLISVRTDVVLSTLVEEIHAVVMDRVGDPLPGDVEQALREISGHPLALRLARAGYVTRRVELARFAPARAPLAPFTATLAELSEREPAGRPEPDDPNSVTWQIPGPGGHVRHFLALRAIGNAGGDAARQAADSLGLEGPAALKRYWVHGFLLAAQAPG